MLMMFAFPSLTVYIDSNISLIFSQFRPNLQTVIEAIFSFAIFGYHHWDPVQLYTGLKQARLSSKFEVPMVTFNFRIFTDALLS